VIRFIPAVTNSSPDDPDWLTIADWVRRARTETNAAVFDKTKLR